MLKKERRLAMGARKDEVQAIFGKPHREDADRWDYAWRLGPQPDGEELVLEITFANDHVCAKTLKKRK